MSTFPSVPMPATPPGVLMGSWPVPTLLSSPSPATPPGVLTGSWLTGTFPSVPSPAFLARAAATAPLVSSLSLFSVGTVSNFCAVTPPFPSPLRIPLAVILSCLSVMARRIPSCAFSSSLCALMAASMLSAVTSAEASMVTCSVPPLPVNSSSP